MWCEMRGEYWHVERVAGPSTAPLAMKLREAPLRMTDSVSIHHGRCINPSQTLRMTVLISIHRLRAQATGGYSLEVFDVFGLQAHADEASSEVFEARDVGEDSQGERRLDGVGAAEDVAKDSVGEDLRALGVVDGGLAILLDLPEVMLGEGV
jgi:hypothetical protein